MDNFSINALLGDVLITTTNSLSAVVCLVAAALVVYLRLYDKVVYRLALYQVLASLGFLLADTSQILVNYQRDPEANGRLCTAIRFLIVYCAIGIHRVDSLTPPSSLPNTTPSPP